MGRTLWVMTDKPETASTRRLLEVASERGLTAQRVAPAEVVIDLHPEASLRGLDLPDVVLARMGGGTARAAFDVLLALEALGVPIVSPASALLTARDKFLSALTLGAHGVPTPRTVWVAPGAANLAVDGLGGPPWVVKLPESHQGTGVMRLDSLASLRSVVDALAPTTPRLLVQEYVTTAAGSDVRVIVVHGQVVAAMRRSARGDEFRSNLHLGGVANALAPSEAIVALAVRATAALGLAVAGVDVLEASSGPLVLEVNASPGLVGIESTTGSDVASAILDVVEMTLANKTNKVDRVPADRP